MMFVPRPRGCLGDLRFTNAALRFEHVADLAPGGIHEVFLARLHHAGAEARRDAMARIDLTARRVLAACGEGDALRTNLAFLRRLTKFDPINSIAMRQRIAARLIEADRYVVS